jgi:hypothetical protein
VLRIKLRFRRIFRDEDRVSTPARNMPGILATGERTGRSYQNFVHLDGVKTDLFKKKITSRNKFHRKAENEVIT